MKKRLNEILTRVKRKVEVCDSEVYKQVTIRRWNKGVVLRKVEIGHKIKTKNQFIAKSEDFIFCRLNAHSGAVGFINDELDGSIVTNDFPLFTLDNEIVDLNWFGFFIKSKEFNEICLLSTSGSAQSRIQIDSLLEHEINIPPLEEQIRIAQRLEEAERQSLSIQSESDRLLQDISDFRQEILTRAFRGDLTEQNFDEGTGMELLTSIQLERQNQQPTKGKKKMELAPVSKEEEPYELPPNWTWTRLGNLSSFINGDRGKNYPSKSHFVSEGIPFINAGDLADNEVSKLKMNFISEEKFESLGSGKVRKQDILYCLRGTLGKMGIVKSIDIGAIASSLVIIRQVKIEMTSFIFYFLQSRDAIELISKYDNGTAQPNLSAENVKRFTIPLPPLAEQHRIVAKIEAIFSALDVMEDAITKQKEEAKACYEEILRKETGTTSEEMVEVKVG